MYVRHRGQVRASDTLELKLQMSVSCRLGPGIEPNSSARAAGALNHLAITAAPAIKFLMMYMHV